MSKVVSIFSAPKKDKEKENDEEKMTFEQIMEKNRKNKERIDKERNNANKSVIRSYRLK